MTPQKFKRLKEVFIANRSKSYPHLIDVYFVIKLLGKVMNDDTKKLSRVLERIEKELTYKDAEFTDNRYLGGYEDGKYVEHHRIIKIIKEEFE